MIQYVLMDGHEVDPIDINGWTPFIRNASLSASVEVAELLLKFKADINILDKDKKSALMIAVIKGNAPLVALMVEYGADLTITNEYGKTPHDLAIAMDRRVILIILTILLSCVIF
jgi:ankyrin repeat protein